MMETNLDSTTTCEKMRKNFDRLIENIVIARRETEENSLLK